MWFVGGNQQYSYPISLLVHSSIEIHLPCSKFYVYYALIGKVFLTTFSFHRVLDTKVRYALHLMVFLATYLKSNLANKINCLDSLPLKAGFQKSTPKVPFWQLSTLGMVGWCVSNSVQPTQEKNKISLWVCTYSHNHVASYSSSLSHSYHHLLEPGKPLLFYLSIIKE